MEGVIKIHFGAEIDCERISATIDGYAHTAQVGEPIEVPFNDCDQKIMFDFQSIGGKEVEVLEFVEKNGKKGSDLWINDDLKVAMNWELDTTVTEAQFFKTKLMQNHFGIKEQNQELKEEIEKLKHKLDKKK